ncbi:MAG TPA: glycosyltransferase family 4 protein [Thermoanaerobaculia bacterium]|jgi:glycosyltransferase involved in cell wall biosynthesis
MKILHLAAGNRWTGAAAPAFAEVEALRDAGVEAHYAYVGGYKLEAKLRQHDFAHAIIEKAQNPISFARTALALRRFVRERGIDVVHAHLTYDHWLARFAAPPGVRLARTFHARRVLRDDPLSRSLTAKTEHLFVINETFRDVLPRAVFTPPPLDTRQFAPHGASARAQYGVGDATKLVTVIGKLSQGRGFEDALAAFAELRKRMPATKLMIIGHGEHRPALERFAAQLNVSQHVIWAGYHETDLAEHYRASDLLLFTARGSDEGHRAVLEAMACGVPPAVFPIEGIHALVEPPHIAADSTLQALARTAETLLTGDEAALRAAVAERAELFDFAHAAKRLLAAYRAAAGN